MMRSGIQNTANFLLKKRVHFGKNAPVFRLVSAVINKSSGDYLSYGYNNIRGQFSIHAERNAIERYSYSRTQKELSRTVDLMVLRTNMSNSRPCVDCVKYMKQSRIPIRNIWYSADGAIHKIKFQDLCVLETGHMTLYKRKQLSGNLGATETECCCGAEQDSDDTSIEGKKYSWANQYK